LFNKNSASYQAKQRLKWAWHSLTTWRLRSSNSGSIAFETPFSIE